MTVTYEQMAAIMPQAHAAGRLQTHFAPTVAEMEAHEINTPLRAAAYLATVAEETGQFSAKHEISYISTPWSRISQVFSGVKGLTSELVDKWRRLGRPRFDEAFFNHVYADANRPPKYRLGNAKPGDGYLFRGRGPMQLTGRGNYERFFRDLGLPLYTDPDLVTSPELGAKSSAHFWKKNGCNEIADTGDFYAVTKRVNGTHMNMNLRMPYYVKAKAVLAEVAPAGSLLTSKTMGSLTGGTIATVAAGQFAEPVADSFIDTVKKFGGEAMGAMYAPGVLKWVLIGAAAAPLIYVAWRYIRKSRRGEVQHT